MITGMSEISPHPYPSAPPVPAGEHQTGWSRLGRFAASGLLPFSAACVAWGLAPFLLVAVLLNNLGGSASRGLWMTLLQIDLSVFPAAVVLGILAIRRNSRPGFAATSIFLSVAPALVCFQLWFWAWPA